MVTGIRALIKEVKTFELSHQGIDSASGFIWQWLEGIKVRRESAMRSRLAFEDALLSILENKDDIKEFSVKLGYSFGSPVIILGYGGIRFDPLADAGDGESTLMYQLMQKMDYVPSYSARHGQNEVIFRIEKIRIKSEVLMAAAVLMAVVIGLLGRYISPDIKDGIAHYGLDLVTEVFMSLLSTFSGFMIFVILINGICGIGNISDFSKIGKTVIGRYISFTLLGGALMTAIALPFFKLQWGETSGRSDLPSQLYDVFVGIFPSNPIKPFYDGDMMQIVFLAIFVGVVMLTLQGRVETVKSFVIESDLLITKAVSVICVMLPLFIFASLLSMFWNIGFGALISMWKPLVLCLIGLIYPVLKLIFISIRYKISPVLILKRISKGLITAFTTSSTVAAFQTIRDNMTCGLGVDSKLFDLSYPIGMQLYNSTYLLNYLLVVLYMAESYTIPVSFVWILLAFLFSVVFATATPCVAGGTLICIGIMMNNLSIPSEALALAGTLSIVMDFVLTSERVFLSEMELYLQARILGMADDKTVRG